MKKCKFLQVNRKHVVVGVCVILVVLILPLVLQAQRESELTYEKENQKKELKAVDELMLAYEKENTERTGGINDFVIDSEGNLYIVDVNAKNGVILKFNKSGDQQPFGTLGREVEPPSDFPKKDDYASSSAYYDELLSYMSNMNNYVPGMFYLNSPQDLAVSESGLFIADQAFTHKYTKDGGFKTRWTFGEDTDSSSSENRPGSDRVAASDNNVFVVSQNDSWQIGRFSSDGDRETVWTLPPDEFIDQEAYHKLLPAANSHGQLFVGHWGNLVVREFNTGTGDMNTIQYPDFAMSHSVSDISSPASNRVVVDTAGEILSVNTSGKIIGHWYVPDDLFKNQDRYQQFAVGPAGSVYLAAEIDDSQDSLKIVKTNATISGNEESEDNKDAPSDSGDQAETQVQKNGDENSKDISTENIKPKKLLLNKLHRLRTLLTLSGGL